MFVNMLSVQIVGTDRVSAASVCSVSLIQLSK